MGPVDLRPWVKDQTSYPRMSAAWRAVIVCLIPNLLSVNRIGLQLGHGSLDLEPPG